MQTLLDSISIHNPKARIGEFGVDGKFGSDTKKAVKAFQKFFNLAADGIIGPETWDKTANFYDNH